MTDLYLECEEFDCLGGWTVDTQSIEAMGSPYLMAHGLGVPVADAVTRVVLPEGGEWHFYARTRDWSRVWNRGTSAGRFQLLVNGCALDEVLGTGSAEWAWQKAGMRNLEAGEVSISLHDLSGFNGRCDALFITKRSDFVPPDAADELAAFKERYFPVEVLDDPTQYDLIVCGGGFAGMTMAISAREVGVRALLVQDRGMLGGCNSSEVRVWLGGLTNIGDYPELGNITAALSPICGRPRMKKRASLFEDDRKANLFIEGENLLLNEAVVGVERDGKRITAVITKNIRTGSVTRRRARLFSDCTGDAVLARFCGCETMYGREAESEYGESLAPAKADRQVMGHSVLWETEETDAETEFPDIDWGIEFNDGNVLRRFSTCWDWETGQYRDQVGEIEYIRDYGLMTALCNWSFLKNHASDNEAWRKARLVWASAIGGKRESYRVVGDYVLSQADIESEVKQPDGTACISWNIDQHFPDPENEAIFGEAFLACAFHHGIGKICPVPYRCLYARDVDNLFLGGRIISASHIAFAAVRVMRTLGMLGEVVAMAAALCVKYGASPRNVYTEHLSELQKLMKEGVRLRQEHAGMPNDNESWHFMRPVGTYDNPTEDVWLHGRYPESSPAKLKDAMRAAMPGAASCAGISGASAASNK